LGKAKVIPPLLPKPLSIKTHPASLYQSGGSLTLRDEEVLVPTTGNGLHIVPFARKGITSPLFSDSTQVPPLGLRGGQGS